MKKQIEKPSQEKNAYSHHCNSHCYGKIVTKISKKNYHCLQLVLTLYLETKENQVKK